MLDKPESKKRGRLETRTLELRRRSNGHSMRQSRPIRRYASPANDRALGNFCIYPLNFIQWIYLTGYRDVSIKYTLALSIILALTPVVSVYGQGQEYPDNEKPGHRYVIAGRYSAMLAIGGDENDVDISGGNGIDVSGGLVLTKWLTPAVYASFHPIESVGLFSSESGSSIGVFGGVKLKSPILLYASLMGGTEMRTVAPSSVAPALQVEAGLEVPLANDGEFGGTVSLGYRASNKAVSLLVAVGLVVRLD